MALVGELSPWQHDWGYDDADVVAQYGPRFAQARLVLVRPGHSRWDRPCCFLSAPGAEPGVRLGLFAQRVDLGRARLVFSWSVAAVAERLHDAVLLGWRCGVVPVLGADHDLVHHPNTERLVGWARLDGEPGGPAGVDGDR